MTVVAYTSKEVDLLARLMRAEAVGEGPLGMLMVGNVGINRVLANCLTFKNITSIEQMVFQSPGGFSGINSSLFYGGATTIEKELALRNIKGEAYYPATNALWFYAPSRGSSCVPLWYDQRLSGRYLNHCFYQPDPGVCDSIYEQRG